MRTRLGPQLDADGLIARLPVDSDVAVVRDGNRTIVGLGPSATRQADGSDGIAAIDEMTHGWWAGFVSYDLGRAVERVQVLNSPTPMPDVAFTRFGTRIVIDGAGYWTVEGDPDPVTMLLEDEPADPTRLQLGPWHSSLDRTAYEQRVGLIHEQLAAGDCYQVNLTRQLSCNVEADPVAMFRRLRTGNPAPHEAFVRIGGVSVVSASPESFLRVDGRRVRTRPIKGTSADPEALRNSRKDRAENVMIVDLSRNDLGRVCEYGSIHVRQLCEVESHPGIYHLVSTVEGTLRGCVTNGDLLRATFPPASVTGCPKPRVLQIIEELEPVRRGVYCGAVGFVDADNGVLDLNVAIRTFTITDGVTTFGVGGGIVADSVAGAEWEETELKARRVLQIVSGAG